MCEKSEIINKIYGENMENIVEPFGSYMLNCTANPAHLNSRNIMCQKSEMIKKYMVKNMKDYLQKIEHFWHLPIELGEPLFKLSAMHIMAYQCGLCESIFLILTLFFSFDHIENEVVNFV